MRLHGRPPWPRSRGRSHRTAHEHLSVPPVRAGRRSDRRPRGPAGVRAGGHRRRPLAPAGADPAALHGDAVAGPDDHASAARRPRGPAGGPADAGPDHRALRRPARRRRPLRVGRRRLRAAPDRHGRGAGRRERRGAGPERHRRPGLGPAPGRRLAGPAGLQPQRRPPPRSPWRGAGAGPSTSGAGRWRPSRAPSTSARRPSPRCAWRTEPQSSSASSAVGSSTAFSSPCRR